MSLLANQYSNNFQIRQSTRGSASTHGANLVLTTGQINKQNCGTTTAIPDDFLLGNTITVTPATVNTTYFLPTASEILTAFGKDISTGVPKLSRGDTLPLKFVNRGTFPAYLSCNPTGGDGSAIIMYQGGAETSALTSTTGSVTPVGKITNIFLEFTNVSGSLGGATGSYTIYA